MLYLNELILDILNLQTIALLLNDLLFLWHFLFLKDNFIMRIGFIFVLFNFML